MCVCVCVSFFVHVCFRCENTCSVLLSLMLPEQVINEHNVKGSVKQNRGTFSLLFRIICGVWRMCVGHPGRGALLQSSDDVQLHDHSH